MPKFANDSVEAREMMETCNVEAGDGDRGSSETSRQHTSTGVTPVQVKQYVVDFRE